MQRMQIRMLVVLAAAVGAHQRPGMAEVAVETVEVGHAGNPADTRYGVPGFGAVTYVYRIGTYEVTAGQYTAFLNAVAAADPYGLYNPEIWSSPYGCKIERGGASGSYTYAVAPDWSERPVNFVSWGDAARFANWLHNGQPTGAQGPATTEQGSYAVSGAMTTPQLVAVHREANATWVLPTEDEWHKAAYHKNDGPTGHYWDYPTRNDDPPSNERVHPDPGNHANYYSGAYTIGSPYWRTVVGDFENSRSAYGTFDQGGNVWEWHEAVLLYNTARGMRGGSYYHYGAEQMRARLRSSQPPVFEGHSVGFRLVRLGPGRSLGDSNCDGTVDFFDINAFALALADPVGYAAAYPECDRMLADIDADGEVTFWDINPFVALLSG